MNISEWIITSCILLALILAIRQIFKEKLSARVRYGMWLLVLVRLLLPISFAGSNASVLNLLPENRGSTQAQDNPNPEVFFDSFADTNPTIGEQQINGFSGSQPADNGAALTGKNTSGSLNQSGNTSNADATWHRILSGIWIAGMVVCALTLLFSNLAFMRKLRLTRMAIPADTANAVQGNSRADHIPVYVSNLVSTPCLFGLFRPAIYIRQEDAENRQNLPYILKHEYTHYRHKDHIWAFCRSLCLAIHWYNPLVWLGAYLNRQDGELACDESVTAGMADTNRLEYGRILIDLTKSNSPYGDMLCCATSMSGGKKNLKERVKRIAWQRKLFLIPTAAVIALCLAVSWVTFTAAKEDTPQQPSPQENSQPDENGDAVDGNKDSAEPDDTTGNSVDDQPENIGNGADGQPENNIGAEEPDEFTGAEKLVNVMFEDVTHDGVEDAIFTSVEYYYEEEALLSIEELLHSYATTIYVRVYDGNTFSSRYSTDKEKWAQLALAGERMDGEQFPSSQDAIWEQALASPHVGNGMVFITHDGGESYLLYNSTWTGQGMGAFSYEVFSLDNSGNQIEKDSGQMDFSLTRFFDDQGKWEDIFPIPDMLAYTEQLAPWIEESAVVAVLDVNYDPLISRPRETYSMNPLEIWKGFLGDTPTGMDNLEEMLKQTLQEIMEG